MKNMYMLPNDESVEPFTQAFQSNVHLASLHKCPMLCMCLPVALPPVAQVSHAAAAAHETLSKWNINLQSQLRFLTPLRLKYSSFCDISQMQFTRLTTASLATVTFNNATLYHISEMISTNM